MKMLRSGFFCRFAAGLLFSLAGAPLMAQAPATAPPAVIDMGDTAWMLAASALVLLMTPGLALFYGGMVRSKNVLGTMMHSIFCMGLISVQWVLFGYTLAFGPDKAGGFIGGLDNLFLRGVSHETPFPGYKVPVMAFMVFQMMFAIITPALITGAFAERVKFVPYALFMLLWSTLVYDPIAHWVWGGGLLANVKGSWLERTVGVGALDFAATRRSRSCPTTSSSPSSAPGSSGSAGSASTAGAGSLPAPRPRSPSPSPTSAPPRPPSPGR
jgi:Amt family ammonium transporter